MNRLNMAVLISEALPQLLCGINSALVLSVAAIGGTSPASDAIRCGAEVETRGRPRCCCGAHSELNIGSPKGGYPNLLEFSSFFFGYFKIRLEGRDRTRETTWQLFTRFCRVWWREAGGVPWSSFG